MVLRILFGIVDDLDLSKLRSEPHVESGTYLSSFLGRGGNSHFVALRVSTSRTELRTSDSFAFATSMQASIST